MVTKLSRGEACKVDAYVDEWRGFGIDAVPLPGHTLGHTGYLTADGVLFTGDWVYETPIWARHRLPYAIDPGLVLSLLSVIEGLGFEWLVPGHGVAVDREEALEHIAYHRERMDEMSERLHAMLREPLTTEQAVAAMSELAGLSDNPAQYWLAVTTVKGYLSDLLSKGAPSSSCATMRDGGVPSNAPL